MALNFFCVVAFSLIFSLKVVPYFPLAEYRHAVNGIYFAWTATYLFLYWVLDKKKFHWHEGLKTIHLIGSIGLGSLTYLIALRYLILTDFSKPLRSLSPCFSSIWSEIEIFLGNFSVATSLMFLFLQLFFLINLVRTLAKGHN